MGGGDLEKNKSGGGVLEYILYLSFVYHNDYLWYSLKSPPAIQINPSDVASDNAS